MSAEHVTCNRCGNEAAVKINKGFLSPGVTAPNVKVTQIIVCPNCGEREQAEQAPME